MSKSQLVGVVIVLIVGAGLAAVILQAGAPTGNRDVQGEHAEAAHAKEDHAKGPHGGRLLRNKDFAVEVTIFERGVPPQFRVYSYEADRPVDPAEVQLAIELHRLGGEVNRLRFTPREGYLLGDQVVSEPHSFDVKVSAERNGRTANWEYSSYEGRVQLTDEAVRDSGITVETAGPTKLRTKLRVTGQIVANEDRMAHLIPRFPGIVKEARKRLGDRVENGEVLAVIQSNESLQSYELRSQLAGTVIKKHVSPGEFVGEGEDVYVVADLSTVWVDLNVYRQDFARVKVGQRVVLDAGEGLPKAESSIAYLSPFGASNTQTMLARVELPNPTGEWRPGLFVSAEVIVEEVTVPVAAKASALQTFRAWDVVFIRVDDLFEVRPVDQGRRDGEWVEVLSGLGAGQRYAAENSFVLKAELGKAGATHDH
ncbi:MAG: efflux RND transporter periplasmic adaptor subunit [Deltaproteobacteria bacterium]|nr:efflux RND transporter periplasmic adaptor subunit [Deltaproteobacteria bacterium]